MKLLGAISQVIAVITAVLYFAGWSYLYAFFQDFSIGFNEVSLSLQDIVSYSFVVLRHLMLPLAPYLVPAAFLTVLIAIERSLLIRSRGYVAFAVNAKRLARTIGKLFDTTVVKLGLMAALFVVIDFAANDAAHKRVTELRENQPGTIHIDFKMEAPPDKAKCTEGNEPGSHPQSYANIRIFCQIAVLERADNLKFLWQSDTTLYVFNQRRRADGCLESHSLVFRIPIAIVQSSEIVADFSHSTGQADAPASHRCD